MPLNIVLTFKKSIMKKILFIFFLTVTLTTISQAQTITKTKYSGPKTTNLQPIPVVTQTPPQPPPAPKSNKTESAIQKSDVQASVYSLSSVRVNIRTGSDNKEFPSKVIVTVKKRDALTSDWSPFSQLNLSNEMRINSDTEFGLERDPQLRGDVKLDDFQKSGLKLQINYYTNFFC